MASQLLPASRRADLPIVRASPGVGPLVILLGLLVVPIGLAVSLDGSTYDTWGAFVWGPVLMALAFPLCRWTAKRTGEPQIAGFLFGAAALKIVFGSTSRYLMVDALYGAGDSLGYDRAGGELAEPFRQGVFQDLGKITGTRFIEIVTGVVQAIIGETRVGSFLVFSMLGFVGMCLLYVAFCEAVPGGDRRLYRWLLFLTPTLWFWPSSIGKEAFLMLCLGGAGYGFSRLLTGHPSGVVPLLLGLWGGIVVRPHFSLLVTIAMVVALPPSIGAARGAHGQAGRGVRRALLPLLVLPLVPLLFASMEQFFGIEELNLQSANEVREDVVDRTQQGGSEFSPPDTNSPVGLLQGLVTVIVRPFPWESDGPQILASVETIGLLVIFGVVAYRRRARMLAAFGQRWSRGALAYVLAFAWAFSAVANFGILARQRSLMLPFLFVVFAAAPATARSSTADEDTADQADDASAAPVQLAR